MSISMLARIHELLPVGIFQLWKMAFEKGWGAPRKIQTQVMGHIGPIWDLFSFTSYLALLYTVCSSNAEGAG
jgi:hypothetical protein